MGKYFGVGIRAKSKSLFFKLVFKLSVILYYTVVNYRSSSRALRMGVFFCRLSVRCPAGMTYTQITLRRIFINFFLQFCKLASAFKNRRMSVLHNSNARGIIAPVLKTLEAFHQDRNSFITLPHIPYNSAHLFLPSCAFTASCFISSRRF